MADGGVDVNEIDSISPPFKRRPRRRALAVAGVVLIGLAVVALLFPTRIQAGAGFPSTGIESVEIDCGAPIKPGPESPFVSNGRFGTELPCGEAKRNARVVSASLAVIGAGFLAVWFVGRRQDRTVVRAA